MNDQQLLRYNRQIMLPQIGYEGQLKLLAAHVVIIGLGGLGSPVAMYLAAAGVGTLTLVDFDHVDLSNLQRQILHRTDAVGMAKSESGKRTLNEINPECEVVALTERLAGPRLDQEVALMPVLEAQQFRTVLLPAAGFLP